MRILILVDCYLPSRKSSASLVYDLAAEFVRQGHNPVVLTPDPDIAQHIQLAQSEGIDVVRVKAGRTKGVGKILRAINESLLPITTWWHARKYLSQNRCDYIVFYSPTIFWGPLVKWLKRVWRCKSYLILRDIFPQWAIDAGVLKPGLISIFFQKIERLQYSVADGIGVQTPANIKYFEGKSWSAGLTINVLYNWAPIEKANVCSTNYRSRLGLEQKIVFFYGGNIGVAQDMDNILRLAERLSNDQKSFFLLVGDGSEVPRLRGIIAKKNIPNILILNSVTQEDYFGMLREFDVGLLSLDKKLSTQNFPGKILGYMQAGMPILASPNPDNDICAFLSQNKAALVAVNGQDNLLESHARSLIENRELRMILGQNSRRLLVENFAVNKIAEQLLNYIKY